VEINAKNYETQVISQKNMNLLKTDIVKNTLDTIKSFGEFAIVLLTLYDSGMK